MQTVLSKKSIKDYIGDDIPVFVYDVIDSTNNEAKKMLREGLNTNAVLVANEQSNGRGRQGKSFFSPAGTGLYMSVVLKSHSVCESLFITTAASVLISQAVAECTGVQLSIKWVNDLYMNDKKVCGILTEAVRSTTGELLGIVVGVGINLSTQIFPDDLTGIATAIGANVDRNILCARIAHKLMTADISVKKDEYLAEYKNHSMVLNKDIIYYINNTPHYGRAVDINDSGALVVENDNERVILDSGEITIRVK